MNQSHQTGFTLPELLAVFITVGMLIGILGTTTLGRWENAQRQARLLESQRLAALVTQAHSLGLLATDASTPQQLQEAWPDAKIPALLPGGLKYTFATDQDDPRILIHLGEEPTPVRAPLPRGTLRIPLWQARLQRPSPQ